MRDIDFIFQVHKIINKKKWIPQNFITDQFMEDICSILSELSDEEQKLYLSLLEEYEIFPDCVYTPMIINGMKKLNIVCDELYVIPSVSKKDLHNTSKSGFYVERLFKSPQLQKRFPRTQFKFRPIPKEFKKNILGKIKTIFKKKSNCSEKKRCFIFVDDFTGSGTTGYGAVKRFLNQYKVKPEDVYYFSIVTMEAAEKKIKKLGVNFAYTEIYSRGISDKHISKNEIQKLLEINRKICEKYGISDPRGFNKCESLVTMINTPNNTFPIFWDEKIKTPPFPRFET